MGWPIENLYIEDGRQPAQPLRADAQRVDLIVNLYPKRLDVVARPAHLQLRHVDWPHQRFLGEQHRLFCRTANADAQHARRAPACAHLRQHFQHPIDNRIAGIHHLELAFVFAAAALGRDIDGDGGTRHHFHVQDAGRVIPGVAAGEGRVGKDGCAQLVFRVQIGAANALIDYVLQ